MSYSIIRGLRVSNKNLRVDWNHASNNVTDHLGRLCFNKTTHEYKTEEAFNDGLYGIANGILSGDLRISNKHSIARRLEEIINRGLIVDKNKGKADWTWYEVLECDEAIGILRGEITFPKEDYIIKSNINEYEYKRTSTGIKLTVGKGATVIPSKRLAELELKNIEETTSWVRDYDLRLERV